jgi:uncharacterized BrkB/YihY/UPF0761 family membrane protein
VNRIKRWGTGAVRLLKYLVLRTESHAYCGSLAFFALIGFFPFCSVLLWIARYVLQWPAAEAVIDQTLREYYPQSPDFLLRNLDASVAAHGSAWQPFSVFWVLLGAAGIFIPLETAFNQIWGARSHRPYWKNQGVGFLLTCACCLLAMLFVLANALLQRIVAPWSGIVLASGRSVALRALGVGFSMMVIFLFYKFLPNKRVPTRRVLMAALGAGLASEAVRALYMVLVPVLHLETEQGPYYVSVSFALLAYFETFVLLGGCFLAAGRHNFDDSGDSASADSERRERPRIHLDTSASGNDIRE